jgi:hypothetical protein
MVGGEGDAEGGKGRVVLLLCGLGRELEENSGGWGASPLAFLVFLPRERGGAEKKKSLGLGFFFFFLLSPLFNFKIAPPLCVSCGPIFIGKMLFGPQNWSLNFPFFINFDFSCFF